MRSALSLLALGALLSHPIAASDAGPAARVAAAPEELLLQEAPFADARLAESLFAAAETAVWDLETGRLLLAARVGEGLEATARPLGRVGATDFLRLVSGRYPRLLAGRHLVKRPILVDLGQVSGPTDAAAVTYLDEGFETDPFTVPPGEGASARWTLLLLDGDQGWVDWGWSACGAHGGSRALDGARGGGGGLGLPCADPYPHAQSNLCAYGKVLDLRGSQAWLQAWIDLATDPGSNDRVAFLFRHPLVPERWLGYELSGTTGGWFRAVFNLKAWPGDIDLSTRPDAAFGLMFASDEQGAEGFGVRVDDLKTLRGDLKPPLTCSAAATPSMGTVPLDTMLVGTATGATAAATYSWITGDGSVLAGTKSHAYEYEGSGEHDAVFVVRDVLGGVPVECRATVHLRAYAPGNDPCSRAAVIPQAPFAATFSTTGYSRDGDEPACAQTGATAWYRYAAPSNGSIDVSLCGSSFDTTLGIYTGACGAMTSVGCDDDGCSGAKPSPSLLTGIPVRAGTTYWIQAGGFGLSQAATGDARLDLAFTPCSQADLVAPAVQAPAGAVVVQTECAGPSGGAAADSSPALAAFLAGGTAEDVCSAAPERLAPMLEGAEVAGSTLFPAGQTANVTFRFRDAAGNVGTAVSSVRVVRRGDVTLDPGSLVDVADLVTMAGLIVGNVTAGVAPYLAPLSAGDTDGDGDVDVFDLVRTAAYIVGNVPCLVGG